MVFKSSRGAVGRFVGRGALLAAGLGMALSLAGARQSAAASLADVSFTGSRIYFDFTSKDNKDGATGIKSNDSGIGADVKRMYVSINYKVDDTWSMNFTSDIGDQGTRRYDVFVKKAYIQGHFSDAFNLRLGSADLPWVPYVEDAYGYRYVEQVITDHLSFGSSADWGVHAYGKAGIVDYAVSAINGRGYSNPARSKSVDFEARVGLQPIDGLKLAVGAYSGNRGQETDTVSTLHTADRQDALVAYSKNGFRFGGEYFQAKNWNNLTTVPTDKATGFSTWGSVPLSPEFAVFARYDNADPSKDLKPKLKFTYYNLGAQYTFNAALVGSLVWKHADVKGGTLSTGNGTIGSAVATDKGKYDEFGVFMQLKI